MDQTVVERERQATTVTGDDQGVSSTRSTPETLALVIGWSPSEPGRLGEICVVPPTRRGATFVLGRGPQTASDPHPRLGFVRDRPGVFESRPPLASPRLSRVQLWVRPNGADSLTVRNVGRCPLRHNGVAVQSREVQVVPGETLSLGQELLLFCVRRQAWSRSLGQDASPMPFGRADPHGFVGESSAAWELRRHIAFAAPRHEHVLVLGESGTGKELVARALHALSQRAQSPLVARSAATLPEGLVDAELFGHARNYPSSAMPERPGLVGQAAGGTLFLDELAELPPALQTHLLRVLDAGEYQRLGESTTRISDFRLIAATNRPERIRDELVARLKLSLRVPSLNERPEDVPLLVVHLLRTIAHSNPDVAARIFASAHSDEEPRVALDFMDMLVRRQYKANVRELERVVWEALAQGPDRVLDRAPSARTTMAPQPPEVAAAKATVAPAQNGARHVTADMLQAALVANDESIERTWRVLGFSSRHALTRLMAKHGIRRNKS